MKSVYLDWAATSVPDPGIHDRIHETALRFFANPSSKHAPGREAAELLTSCRKTCAALTGVPPESLIFTSGGTESNNMIISSILNRRCGGRVIVSAIEHPSCAEPAEVLRRHGFTVDIAAAGSSGHISPETVENLLKPDTCMVIVMAVNNETGAIQPVEEIVRRIRSFEKREKRRIHVHCDAVQALGKIPFFPADIGVDSASFSAHKITGPRGVGLLYIRQPGDFIYRGGGQEYGLRHGTENLPGILGMSLAMEKTVSHLEDHRRRAAALKAELLNRLSGIRECTIVPKQARDSIGDYSPYILSVSVPPLPGEALVRSLSDRGIAVSTGSACSVNKKKNAGSLAALGIDAKILRSVIRISTGFTTAIEDIDAICYVLKAIGNEA